MALIYRIRNLQPIITILEDIKTISEDGPDVYHNSTFERYLANLERHSRLLKNELPDGDKENKYTKRFIRQLENIIGQLENTLSRIKEDVQSRIEQDARGEIYTKAIMDNENLLREVFLDLNELVKNYESSAATAAATAKAATMPLPDDDARRKTRGQRRRTRGRK